MKDEGNTAEEMHRLWNMKRWGRLANTWLQKKGIDSGEQHEDREKEDQEDEEPDYDTRSDSSTQLRDESIMISRIYPRTLEDDELHISLNWFFQESRNPLFVHCRDN